MKKSIFLATSTPWNEFMVRDLQSEFPGYDFHLITKKEELNVEVLKEKNARFVFFPHWSFIIPKTIFNQFECVIFHMTDLPYGRGGSPLQNLIVRGHKTTKISAIKCSEVLDGGPIYTKEPLSLDGSAREIFGRTSKIVLSMIRNILTNNISPTPQSGEAVNFQRRTPKESNLEEINDLEKVYDYIRMLDADGYPHAFLEKNSLRYEFTDASLKDGVLEAKVKIFRTQI